MMYGFLVAVHTNMVNETFDQESRCLNLNKGTFNKGGFLHVKTKNHVVPS